MKIVKNKVFQWPEFKEFFDKVGILIGIFTFFFFCTNTYGFSDPEQRYLDRILPVAESYIEQYGVEVPYFAFQDGIPESDTAIGAHYPDGRIGINAKRFFIKSEGDRRMILVHELLHSLDSRPFNKIWTERWTQYISERIIMDQVFKPETQPYYTQYLDFIFGYYATGDLVIMYISESEQDFLSHIR